MSILNFSEYKYIKSFDAAEEIRMGGFQTQSSGLLGSIRVLLYIQDFTALAGTETLVMKVYNTIKYETAYVTSDIASLSDVTFDTSDAGKTNFLGYLTFTFSSEMPINLNKRYYPTVTVANYTPAGDTFYLGLGYDWPDPVYDNGGTTFFDQAIAHQIFLKQVRDI